jgi:alpha-D-xyloside xylohydrolase
MKFTSGYWDLREGVKMFSPKQAYSIEKSAESLTVFAPCKTIQSRGDVLNIPQLTVAFSTPMPDVIRVQICHFKGTDRKGPFFEIAESVGLKPVIDESEETVSLSSGKMKAVVHKQGPWAVDFLYDGRFMTGTGRRRSGYVIDENGDRFMTEQLSLGVGEYVYGLGERFTSLIKNGQVVDMWNEDGGTSSEIAYKNVPFYMTNRGYGVLVAHPEKVSFEVASEDVSRVQFSVPGEYLEYYLVGGGTPKEVLHTYTQLTGRAALPPAWSFGLWLTTSFTTTYDEKTVNSFIDGMKERDIPLNVFHFDCFWMKGFQWCDFKWDIDAFPDPAGMLQRLKKKGLHICVWINPYIAQKSSLFEEGKAAGYLVKKADGGVWQWDRWQSGMGLVDFTNPAAVSWFQGCLRKLIKMGVDCFKTDFGERIPVDVVYHDGSDPVSMHNYYTYLYNRTVFEVLEEEYGKNHALLFARSGTAGSQKFPIHWGGDCSATYESMAETLRGGLSLGMSGFGFWSHDISGFEKTATPDLYKRWSAFGLLSTHSRLHGSESYRVPWLFDAEAVDVLRFFVRLKCTLMPYIFSAACRTTRTGVPMMRAMVLEFPDDPTCAFLDRQYMLGDDLLVAPVFSDDGSVTYYLPRGRWTNFITGEQKDGGSWQSEKHDYFSLPLMARGGSVIAVGTEATKTDYDYADGVTFHLFELNAGEHAEGSVFDMEGNQGMSVSVERTGDSLAIAVSGAKKPWKVQLRNVPSITRVDGGTASSDPLGVMLHPTTVSSALTVRL